MEINSTQDIEADLKPKADLLKMSSTKLKKENDTYGFLIMTLSLMISGIESAKLQLGMDNNKVFKLAPVVLGLVVGALSSFVKFKNYTGRLETLLNGINELNLIVTKVRDADTLSKEILAEYHKALEIVENAVSPQDRADFLKLATKNLVLITKSQIKYRKALDDLNVGKIPDPESSVDSPPLNP